MDKIKVNLQSDTLPEGQSKEAQEELEKLRDKLKKRAGEQKEKNGLLTTVIEDAKINNVTLEEFRSSFRNFGVTVNTYPKEDGRTTVAISWLPSKLSEMSTSRGGRPTRVFHTGYTVGEIFNLLAADNPPIPRRQLYDITGMSKTTFYKRVQYYKEHPDLNEEFH